MGAQWVVVLSPSTNPSLAGGRGEPGGEANPSCLFPLVGARTLLCQRKRPPRWRHVPPAVAAASLRVGKTCKGVGKSWCSHGLGWLSEVCVSAVCVSAVSCAWCVCRCVSVLACVLSWC